MKCLLLSVLKQRIQQRQTIDTFLFAQKYETGQIFLLISCALNTTENTVNSLSGLKETMANLNVESRAALKHFIPADLCVCIFVRFVKYTQPRNMTVLFLV